MRLRSNTWWHWRPPCLILVLVCLVASWSSCVSAKDTEPAITSTKFPHRPDNLFYFDDSEVALVTDAHDGVLWRSTDAGTKWEKVEAITEGELLLVVKHPYNNQVAVALGGKLRHWITNDQGKGWRSFKIEIAPTAAYPAISFHAEDPDKIIFQGQTCVGGFFGDCKGRAYVTKDGFKNLEVLFDKAASCMWAKSTARFTTGRKDDDANKVLCIVEGKYSGWQKDFRLVTSSDYFDSDIVEPAMDQGRAVMGITRLAAVRGYFVTAAKAEGTDELALYVSDDTETWHRAEFGDHTVQEDAYTVLESTNYSIQVDVMTNTKPSAAMGVLFTSNSNGTYFTKNIDHTNRNFLGLVDFEKVQGIQGIVMVNTVQNWEKVESGIGAEKQLRTSISFDDGRSFQPMRTEKFKHLHLHSVTDQHNFGRVFSSFAPGIVMGVGNTGEYLKDWNECDLFVSDDAGVTWTKAIDDAHMYEFGDQGSVLVAVKDEGRTDTLKWSLNHGKKWETMKFDDKLKPLQLTTLPDSTSLKFIMVATKGGGENSEHYIYSIDFTKLNMRKCKNDDFEKWYARVDEKGEPRCIMGHKQWYARRKADAECFIDTEFKDPQPEHEPCTCTDEDYECDYNFVKSRPGSKECVPAGKLAVPEGQCKDPNGKFMGSSGYRLIPGNDCIKKGGVVKDEPVERHCSESSKQPSADGKIKAEVTGFDSRPEEYHYLERTASSTGDDETVVMRTHDREVYITHDHGKEWFRIPELKNEEVLAVYPHQFFNDIVYFVTPPKDGASRVFYSKNRGKAIHSFKAPDPPNLGHLQILAFHPSQKDWLLWTGSKDCEPGKDCHATTYVSRKGGEDGSWQLLLSYVRECQFIYREVRRGSEKLIYCERYEDEDDSKPLQLLSSEDWFEETRNPIFDNVIRFAMMSEFVLVARKNATDQSGLMLHTTINGKEFAQALFPNNFHVDHQQAYTVLDSSTRAIFLHVTVNDREDQEYGSILKSNSNGTSYVVSLHEVNRNKLGYVDFEKMQGLEGVAIVNVVANAREASGGAAKKLKTMVTHNDGAEWALITPPEKDPDGRTYECISKGRRLDTCALHLHGYTERRKYTHTFSSPSAVGLMLGVGNVGETLGKKSEGDTFITRDGGVSWQAVMKGVWMWEYGDQGSIIVIVKEDEPTNTVLYTLNEGKDWREFEFSNEKLDIEDITTVPSDTSRNFLLWGKQGSKAATVNLDFSGLTDRPCNLDEKDPEGPGSDYYLWTPKHPLSDSDCLFGHVAQYHRKKDDAKCFNGREIQHLHDIARNCSCTRQDFECDYNYERQADGSCALVPGLSPLDPASICDSESKPAFYSEVTGYRRIPITTCQGGPQFDRSELHPCPGREEEFNETHGVSGWALFFAIVLPMGAAAGIGYYVYTRWDGKFGRIRLGDSGPTFQNDSPWVRYPVAAISALVAVVAAAPMVAGSLWRWGKDRIGRGSGWVGGSGYGGRTFTSRSSFQRGRGQYSVVDEDEGELLGEESDDETAAS